MSATIRNFEPRDTNAVEELLQYLMQVEGAKKTKENALSVLEERILSSRRETETVTFVAEIEGKVTGLLILEFPVGNVARVVFIVVDPEHQKLGIGKQLIEHAIAVAKARGTTTLETMVQQANLKSRDFHEHFGFTLFGVVLRKSL